MPLNRVPSRLCLLMWYAPLSCLLFPQENQRLSWGIWAIYGTLETVVWIASLGLGGVDFLPPKLT